MSTWIALFRGINVGGNNILRMADLKADLAALGLQDVRTYIQSGNVVFDAPGGGKGDGKAALTRAIGERVEARHGFRPKLLLLKRGELEAAVAANPFPQAVAEPSSLHFSFLETPAEAPDVQALEAARAPNESYELTERVFYLHAPDGIARSKLAARAEAWLGVAATARNYRTVEKLLAMVEPGR